MGLKGLGAQQAQTPIEDAGCILKPHRNIKYVISIFEIDVHVYV
jgi:hypothetical protein